jgi:hypothetical protein
MTSYQKRKREVEQLKQEVEYLKQTLYQESKVFYSELKWLGLYDLTTGLVVNGQLKEVHRQKFTPTSDIKTKVEVVF